MAARIALKVDVDTYRGTLVGVPQLVDILRRNAAGATFLFSLGPDHTGRAIKRAFRPGFMNKVGRTSVVSHYGLLTLMYGTVLPGPDIGRRGADIMRGVAEAGFETGIHCWDHVKWQDGVEKADAAWTAAEMKKAVVRYQKTFGSAPLCHGAAGWQMNAYGLRLTQSLGFAWSSDTRGTAPFLPVWNGELIRCPQLPTTLPTLDELIGIDGVTADDVDQRLLQLTATPADHVFTLHAELEGMKLAPVLERLLTGWREQGYEIVSVGSVAATLDLARLPRCEVVRGELPGRSGTLMLQGKEFLAEYKEAA
jgi:peptidoglycan/xylan/chitin deacetylase (PgdA/CDA1 family)